MKKTKTQFLISLVLILSMLLPLSAAFADCYDIPVLSEEEQEKLYMQGIIFEKEGNPRAAAIAFGKAGDFSDAQQRSINLWNSVLVREKTANFCGSIEIENDGTVNYYPFYEQSEFSSYFDSLSNIVQVVDGALCAGDIGVGFLRSDGTACGSDNYKYGLIKNAVKLSGDVYILLRDGRIVDGFNMETVCKDIVDVVGTMNGRYVASAFLRLDGTVVTDYLSFSNKIKQEIASLEDVRVIKFEDGDFNFYCGNGTVHSYNGAYYTENEE